MLNNLVSTTNLQTIFSSDKNSTRSHSYYCSNIYINVNLVEEFQRWWVLKSKLFGQESTCHQGKIFKKFLGVMTVCQKLGVILESKVVQKFSLEKKVF